MRCGGTRSGRMARERGGAWVIYGGIHATLFPEETCRDVGQGHAVVKG